MATTLSVIIPALNEEAAIVAAVGSALGADPVEVIVVDGGSRDRTAEVAGALGATVLSSPIGRARQMNAGAEVADGEILLFLHADSTLPTGYDQAVREALAQPGTVAGAFRLGISGEGRGLRIIERLVQLRSTMGRLPYGDQGLFVRAETFRRLGGYAELPIMEDVEMVRRLRRLGRIAICDEPVVTSGRRWQHQGAWRTTARNQLCLAAYNIGVPPERIARWRRSFTA